MNNGEQLPFSALSQVNETSLILWYQNWLKPDLPYLERNALQAQ